MNIGRIKLIGAAIIAFFVFVTPALADVQIPEPMSFSDGACDSETPPSPGKVYAIFGITSSGSFPASVEEKCVLVDSGAIQVSTPALRAKGLVMGAWNSAYVSREVMTCRGGFLLQFISGDGGRNLVDATESPVEMYFDLKKTGPNTNCQSDHTELQAPSRWHIGAPANVYLYFLGFADNSTNEIKDCGGYSDSGACTLTPNCFWQHTIVRGGVEEAYGQCKSKVDRSICVTLPQSLCGSSSGSPACAWNATTNRCITALEEDVASRNRIPRDNSGNVFSGALPACAFEGTCNDINDLLRVAVNYAKGAFGILGTFAFAFFVYGGFTIIISMGNSEKVKKGQDMLVAAVIGIIICFSAYAAIDFLLDALRVSSDFRIIK